MSENKAIKSVSFNARNPKDAVMMEAVKRRNFSGYVKELIWADLKKGEEPAAAVPAAAEHPVSRLEQLKNRLARPLLNQSKR